MVVLYIIGAIIGIVILLALLKGIGEVVSEIFEVESCTAN
jgi:hypothetical protein